jgi:hypothetical protein
LFHLLASIIEPEELLKLMRWFGGTFCYVVFLLYSPANNKLMSTCATNLMDPGERANIAGEGTATS